MAAFRGRGGGRGRGRGPPEGEVPDAHIAEEGKRVIRNLVARQTDGVATLEQQQAREREREFHRASAVLPLGDASFGPSGAGASSLRDFAASAGRAARIEELARTGLPLSDLRLLLEDEEKKTPDERLTVPERLAREERLRAIREKVTRSSTSAGEREKSGPSRHVQELGSSLSPLARLALDATAAAPEAPGGGGGAPDDVPHFREAAPHGAQHPVHRLAAMERGMFGHLDAPGPAPPAPPPATSRKRRRQRQAVDQPRARDPRGGGGVGGSEDATSSGSGSASLWDVRDAPDAAGQGQQGLQARCVKTVPAAAYGPARPKQYTIRDGSIVELPRDGAQDDGGAKQQQQRPTTGGVFVPTGRGVLTREDLERNRLTPEEIKQQPRFSAYEEGTPSNVLYVKNLDGAVTEDDLAAVFGCFQRPGPPGPPGPGAPSLRLCGGRMRGQAFVTFPAQEDAAAALGATNGYLLKGRPMIVQFGRGQC